jgi:hypothetical protein
MSGGGANAVAGELLVPPTSVSNLLSSVQSALGVKERCRAALSQQPKEWLVEQLLAQILLGVAGGAGAAPSSLPPPSSLQPLQAPGERTAEERAAR